MPLDTSVVGAIAGLGPQLMEQIQGPIDARAAGQRANEARAADAALQREFAQSGIRWKVQDAIAAGIHPLYALGANTHSYTGSFSASNPADFQKSQAYGRMADMGQNLGRALAATRTADERSRAFQDEQIRGQQLDNEGKALNNQLLASQLSRQNSAQVGPGMPQELSSNPDVGWATTAKGVYPVPGDEVKNRIEDSPHEYTHFLRNNILPNFGAGDKPPFPPKGGGDWQWSYTGQQWVPASKEVPWSNFRYWYNEAKKRDRAYFNK